MIPSNPIGPSPSLTGLLPCTNENNVSLVDAGDKPKFVKETPDVQTGGNGYVIPLTVTDEVILPENKSSSLIVGESLSVRELTEMISRIADIDSKVLITGETGTGKELVAREIHKNSLRRNELFIPVNCAAIPESIIESELFGHEKGAFTGATGRRIGRFEAADRGTIFLDEIGELSLPLQAKLSRVLENGTIQRAGGVKEIKVNVRVIAATNKNIKSAIKDKQLSIDLFFRLNVLSVHLPPLRERKDDVPELVIHFLNKYKDLIPGKKVDDISPAAIEKLNSHNWPGNIRELENVIRRAVIFADDLIIQPDDIAITEQEAELRSKEKISEIALSGVSVIIYGETGAGKEVVANEIHKLSSRNENPFIVVNCAAVGKDLAESKLFGHEKNSFTGAFEAHKGMFEVADGGTVFLDELAELDINVQAKLLRLLQEGEVVPVGANEPKKVNVRIVAATNVDLENAVKEGKFREDLYHRLNVIPVKVLPLRERRERIPELALELLNELIPKVCPGRDIKGFSPEAMEKLKEYNYPGNVRELKNMIERALVFTDSGQQIQAKDLKYSGLSDESTLMKKDEIHPVYKKYKNELDEHNSGAKKLHIDRVKLLNVKLKIVKMILNNQSSLSEIQIATELGIARATLSNRIQRGGYKSTKDLVCQLVDEIKQTQK